MEEYVLSLEKKKHFENLRGLDAMNLNEYVEALITLKQKIINTDNLLTEYQKKCDELQFARRENSTLHHQVEQMLQKISPLQKCQEELGSLKAELEEKKSSLKLYQETHQEYARIKEECLKTDAQKKKLEAKVKKLEEAAVKQTQDFKQLRNEKKILEKEFKKTQERLDEFSKQKAEKELRNVGTQISSDTSGSINRRKVKLLLKELWLCINTANRAPGESSRCVPGKPVQENPISGESREDVVPTRVGDSPPRTSAVQTCQAEQSMEIEGDVSECKNVGKETPSAAAHHSDDQHPEVLLQRNEEDGADLSDHDRSFDEDLQAAVDFFKLPPPLLSPVPSPPLGSVPHRGTLPSSLAPETYFGEYTDSSDSDSAPHGSSEYISEDDTPEAQDCFGSSRKNKGSGTCEEKLKSHEATQAPNTLKVNEVTTVGFEAFTASPREPSTTFSLAREKHWAVSSQFIRGRKRDILGAAKRPGEVREIDMSMKAEGTFCKPTGIESVEKLSGGIAQGKEAAPGKADMCYSPIAKRPLSELMRSEGKTPLSRMIGSSKSNFTEWTPTNETTCEADCISVSDHLQGLSRELEKEREDVSGFALGESSEPEEDADDVIDAADLDVEAKFSSSSTSGALSVHSNPQFSSGLKGGHDTHVPSELIPTEVRHSEQKLARTSNMSGLQSEPSECSSGANDPEDNLHALNPELGASDFHDQSSSGVECTKVVKDMTKVCALPQSVFMKAVKGGQCESQGPGAELTSQSDFTALVESQSGLIKSGFVKSTSWHHSNLLRRGGEEMLIAKSEHQQETNNQLPKAVPSIENRESASLLPNQVSVITKQTRPEMMQGARLEPLRQHRNEPASVTENVDNVSSIARCAEREETTQNIKEVAQNIKEVAATKETSPEGSTSCRKLDFDSSDGSLPVENSHCSKNSKLSFFSENITVSNQNMMETSVQAELQEQCPCQNATDLDSSGLGADKLPPATEMAASEDFPIKEISSGDPVTSGGEDLAISKDSPSVEQSLEEPLEQPSPTPSCAPEGPGPTDTTAFLPAIGRKDEETHGVPQSSLSGPLYCYTGIREVAGGDTEVEESEAPSCSEGENEPEAVMGKQQQDAAEASRDVGTADAGAAETRPSTEVGCLTSALQDFNISTLSEIDRLSTSEVVMFLESCQLKDYSSGDSVPEYSSKETLNEEIDKELKQNELSGEKYRKQVCEEETLKTCEEWIESEEDDCPLKDASQLTQCSLETLSEVLTKIGQELQSNCEDSDGKDASNLLLFSIHDSLTTEPIKEQVSPQQTSGSLLNPSAPSPSTAGLDAKGSSPTNGESIENTQDRPEDNSDVTRLMDSGDEALPQVAEPPTQSCYSGDGQTAEHSAGCEEAERTFQCQISTVTSKVINKDQNLVIEKGDNWTIISGVPLMPNVDQVILCDTPGDIPASPDEEEPGAGFISIISAEKSPETSHPGSPFQEPPCDSNLPCTQEDISSSGQSSNFDKSRLRNRPVKPSVRISSEIYDFESQIVASDHTYYNSKLEPIDKNKNRSKISNKDQSTKLVKTSAPGRVEPNPGEVSQSSSGDRGSTKTQRPQTQTILANADTSTPTDCSADTLSKIRQEVGPPLPPLLAPLIATPPRTSHPVSPLISSSSPSSPTSPVVQLSPSCEIPVPPMMSPLLEDPAHASPSCTSMSPSAVPAGERILSSPLQFCATTPKHALPVPGRLPPCASTHTAVTGPQENSVKILDTMYPELSARARTLNILKGNIQLTRGPPGDRQNLPGPVSAITGFKAITSMSTAFVKAGGSSSGDCNQDKSRDLGPQHNSGGKRTLSSCTPRSAKRLRLDSGSPEPETSSPTPEGVKHPRRNLPQVEVTATDEESSSVPAASMVSQLPLNPKETVESHDKAIADALKKIAESSFDLLPVIRSHVYVGNISKKPVMRDQEKEVVYDFSTTKKHLAECLLHSILSELKLQKISLEHNYIHALCRVYVGICRQLGDLERARLFCYSLLKEDFPESEKLTLFIANMWHDIFISQSVINKAVQLVARQRAKGEVLNCLRAYLNWEKNAPADVGFMVCKLLLTIQLCPKTEFQSSEKFGEDLSDNTWEYIFAIDLLCCHQKWIWTHDNIISKELWPVMDKWIKYRKGHANIAYIPDIIIASILRLIGRLGQLGLKEGFPSAVKNISSVIGMFIQHAQDEDIPWGIQLAAVYALCDLSPSNPAEISKILEAWRKETSHSVPSAVVRSLEEVSALCAQELG
ncbi:PREDICTED: little elongation complex subunit 1 [Myotis davidii]|uniref:little elongation complex subunit 1 n=1 Tax=Myotis davidii TaxID=225400 RepID=UPI0003EBDF90|nr:PREDICTED: little elongation complex subunit 1 [Myotis davidii]